MMEEVLSTAFLNFGYQNSTRGVKRLFEFWGTQIYSFETWETDGRRPIGRNILSVLG
ncbi:MAG: hypothetical protein BWY09_01945 [Candidatus Hydrogenedentes bacterium ADurb.Bin179]|nr:MAG: hypothetical protein BWY09_01945 [Candidatus Hydrogenedentes bacterium ADurb.Bin179]